MSIYSSVLIQQKEKERKRKKKREGRKSDSTLLQKIMLIGGKKEDGVEEPVFGPDASPQTGIPWQYWRGSQAHLTASTAPVPPGKRVSYGTQLLVQLWRKDSELTSDDEYLQGCL